MSRALHMLPPILREIAWTLVNTMLIVVGACFVFVALGMRRRQRAMRALVG